MSMDTDKLCQDLLTYHFVQGNDVEVRFLVAA